MLITPACLGSRMRGVCRPRYRFTMPHHHYLSLAGFVIGVLAVGCRHPPPIGPTELGVPAPYAEGGPHVLARVEAPGLTAVRCTTDGCTWSGDDGEHPVLLPSLEPGGEPIGSDPLAVSADTEDTGGNAPRTVDLLRQALAQGWRIPFAREIPAPDGGTITYMRGMDSRGATLTKVGGGLRQVRAPGVESPISCSGWLSLGPQGSEAYLLVWPSDTLHAFSPLNLGFHWSLPLGGPGVGLFVDPKNRFLALARTSPSTMDQWTDYEANLHPQNPASDASLRVRDLPPVEAVVLVDLLMRREAIQVPGRWVALVEPEDGLLVLATDAGLATLRWPAPSSGP